jgi:hypothetical protein
MAEKYVLANIKIPMIQKSTGQIESLLDYISIEFEKMDELPPKPDYKANYEFIKQRLGAMLRSDENEETVKMHFDESGPIIFKDTSETVGNDDTKEHIPPLLELHSEISENKSDTLVNAAEHAVKMITMEELHQSQKRKHSKQTSFKNRYGKKIRYTAKEYL